MFRHTTSNMYKRKQVKTAIPKRRYGIESLREKTEGMDINMQHAIRYRKGQEVIFLPGRIVRP